MLDAALVIIECSCIEARTTAEKLPRRRVSEPHLRHQVVSHANRPLELRELLADGQ